MEKNVAVLLHNVRSAHNVGSVFRTSDAAGVSHVYLSGYTPVPLDRFGRVRKEIAKTALGAEKSVSWEYVKNIKLKIKSMKSGGWCIAGIEQDARARDYRDFKVTRPTLYVFGNEVRGLSKQLRDECDVLLEIPMHGTKESLNVAVTAGIILFQFARG